MTPPIPGKRPTNRIHLNRVVHAAAMNDSASELSDVLSCLPNMEPTARPKRVQRRKTRTKRKDWPVQPRRRKHSYLTRKEEMEKLEQEAESLTVELERLKKETEGYRAQFRPMQENAAMKELLRTQKLSLWGAHSLLSNQLKAPHLNPLATHIHLTKDPQQRRDTLMSLCDHKVADGKRFAIERSQGLDPLVPFRREDLYLNSDGDYCCDRYDVTQFENARSIRHVYEAMLFYLFNIEISITEKLGHVTLREDYDSVANRISHQRLVSCDDNGVMHEMNSVTFMQLMDRDQDDDFGVIATDFIDVDDLYPYRPEVNIRKDIVATVVLTAHRRKKKKAPGPVIDLFDEIEMIFQDQQEDEDEDEMVVVMRRGLFVKLHHSDIQLSDSVLQDVRESVTRWNDVAIKSIRDQLASKDALHTARAV